MKKILRIIKYTYLGYLSVCVHDFYKKSSKLQIKYHHSKLSDLIELNPSLSSKTYYPSFFFPTGHLQTIILNIMNTLEPFYKFTNYYNYGSTRKIVNARDGEGIYLDFSYKTKNIDHHPEDIHNYDFLKKYDNSKILVILPGVCGSGAEFYLTDIMERFTNENYKCLTLNHRGVLNYELKKDKLYHAGFTNDIHDTFEFLNANINNSKYFVLGFSMGGNIVAKFLGECGEEARTKYNIYGASTVCSPLDIKKFVMNTEDYSIHKLYSKAICSTLKDVYYRNKQQLCENLSKEQIKSQEDIIDKSRYVSEYYLQFLVKTFGFNNDDHYYNNNSAIYFMKNIRVPFMCLFAEDDPVVPSNCVPDDIIMNNDNIILAISKSGGHVGFFKGLSLKRWVSEPLLEFMRDAEMI